MKLDQYTQQSDDAKVPTRKWQMFGNAGHLRS